MLQAFSILPQADQGSVTAPSQRQVHTRPRASHPAFELALPAEPARINRAQSLPETRADTGREASRPQREERAKPRQSIERNAERTSEPPRSAKARPRLDTPRREDPPHAEAARGRRFLDKTETRPETEQPATDQQAAEAADQTAQSSPPVAVAEQVSEEASVNAAFLAAVVEESDTTEQQEAEATPDTADMHLQGENQQPAATTPAPLDPTLQEPKPEASAASAEPAQPQAALATANTISTQNEAKPEEKPLAIGSGKPHPVQSQKPDHAGAHAEGTEPRGLMQAEAMKAAKEAAKNPQPTSEPALSPEPQSAQPSFGDMLKPAALPGPSAPALPEHPGAAQRAGHPVPVAAVSIEIGLRAMEGLKTFQIRLSPEDLGVIDVSLTFKEDGKVEAAIIVDKPETLSLLQRDQRSLERAFEQAGLRADEQGLSFSLRQDGERQTGRQETGHTKVRSGGVQGVEETSEAKSAPQRLYLRGFGADGRLDIQI